MNIEFFVFFIEAFQFHKFHRNENKHGNCNFKVELSSSKKICFTCFNEKCFLFHLESSFRSRDIFFFLTFWSCRKNGSIRKIVLVS